ncbi:MAG: tetratricopeptide repeat protein [Acidobacteriota bacterium]
MKSTRQWIVPTNAGASHPKRTDLLTRRDGPRSSACRCLVRFLVPCLFLSTGWSQAQGPSADKLSQVVAQNLTDLGIHYYQKQNYPKAAVCFEDALKYQPNNEAYRVNLAMAYLGAGRYEGVISTLTADPALTQPDDRAQTALALAYFATGRYAQAVPFYEKLSQAAPEDVVLQLTLAAVYRLSGQDASADQVLKRLPQDPAVRAHYHVVLADAHRSRSDGPAAIAEYEKALAIAPNTPGVNYRLGGLYSDLNQLEKAGKLFEKELEVSPQNPDAHFSLGMYSLNFRNELDAARRHFERSVQLNPQHLEAYLGLMKTALAQGKPEEALRLAERIHSAGLENGELHYLKSRALNLLGKKEQAESELKLFEQWRSETK